jgi:hypothetical protein
VKHSPAIDAAVGSAKRALRQIVAAGDPIAAHEALDEVGVELVRCMERIGPEAELLRATRQRIRTRN